MVWSWFSAEKKAVEGVAAVGFVRRVVAAAMGCFFGCFRIRDSHLISNPVGPQENMASRNKNALSSLILSDDDSLGKGGEGRCPLPEELDVRELKDEAKFLKACGTLLETPVEIRKASAKWEDTSAQSEKQSSNFNSWLPNASIEKLKLERQPNKSPTPVKICDEWVTGAGTLIGTPSSCMTDQHNTRRDSMSSSDSSFIQNVITLEDVPDNKTHSAISSVSPGAVITTAQVKNKSVRFECEPDMLTFASESSSLNSKQCESAGNFSVSKASPYPTPLKLTDEMQTPGTVFPAYQNNTRIRSQYVYSSELPSQWIELKDENSDSNRLRESSMPNEEATPKSDRSTKYLSVGGGSKDEASVSSLKPHSENQDANEQVDSISGENVHFGRTPGDRPILGLVAAHWNDEETSRISPKWWDGNGIPNSTNKYKEDQKVSWHATPFEERLEKALSEETFISQRKPIIGTPPIEFNETEESDTAFSQLQSSPHPKSVVSC